MAKPPPELIYVTLNVSMPEDLKARVIAAARAEERTVSNWVARVLRQACDMLDAEIQLPGGAEAFLELLKKLEAQGAKEQPEAGAPSTGREALRRKIG